MRTAFTVYELATGKILRSGESNCDQPLAPGEAVVIGVRAAVRTQRIDPASGAVEDVPPTDPTAEQTRSSLLARVAQRRWEIETGGITLNGMAVATDDRSKLLLFAAAERAAGDPQFTTKWKTTDGWVPLDATAILAVREAVFAHVTACFAREEELVAAINEAEPQNLAELAPAIEAFWPAT